SLLFAGATAHVGADGLGGDILRRAMQPPGQDSAFSELRPASRQCRKRALRHVFSQMRIANHAQRCGVDEIHVPAHQFGERGFRVAFGVLAQKLLVAQPVHSWKSSRHRANRTGRNSGPGRNSTDAGKSMTSPQFIKSLFPAGYVGGVALGEGESQTCMKALTAKLWWVLMALWFPLQVGAQPEWPDRSPHKTGFITVNHVKLHYLDWGGAGETFLFLHGMNGTAHFYDDFAPRFTNQFRVLGLTRRGHGESEMPQTGYDTTTLVEDVRQFLDAMKIQRVVLAGHSFAGDELTRFAVMDPDRVIKVIYFDSAYDHSRVPANLRWKPLHGGVPDALPTKEESESPDGGRRWVMRIRGEKTGRMIYGMLVGTYAETHEYRKIKAPTLAFFATNYCPVTPASAKCPGFDRKK